MNDTFIITQIRRLNFYIIELNGKKKHLVIY